MPHTQGPEEQQAHREACPFCRSTDTTTTSKSPDAASYWRCTNCGQIWNTERLQGSRADRFGFSHHGFSR